MGDDEIIGPAAAERVGDVFKIGLVNGLVHRVKYGNLLVKHDVGIVGHAVGHAVNALKAGEAPVVRAHPNLSCAVHS